MDFLKISEGRIVDQLGNPVRLRGVNIGGWMNMEHFINGYPGTESRLKHLMKERLGTKKAEFFFERYLDYFFNEQDVAYLHSIGMNAIRLPLNYRHFESDMAPFEYLETGFARLDQVLKWCEAHEIYVILDLHAAQGWQNGDWHCDNSSRQTLFWTHKQFQDRFISFWQEIARRYRDRAVIAVYNIMNEPLSNAAFGRFLPDADYQPDWEMMNAVNLRTLEAIREVNDSHIVAVEGDYYSVLFSGLNTFNDPNFMYSSHNYIEVTTSPIPQYPIQLGNTLWDQSYIKKQFLETEGWRYAQEKHVPLLVGEFGLNTQYSDGREAHQIHAFADQLEVYNQLQVHWTFWTYKDIGVMGWVQLHPQSEYLKTIRPVLDAKDALRPDFGWLAGFPPEVQMPVNAVCQQIEKHVPGLDPAINRRYFTQAAIASYTGDQLQELFVRQFEDKSETEMDQILQSLKFENCVPHPKLTKVLKNRL